MWGAVLLFALSAMGDPLRIAVAVLLCSRPRPMVNLFVLRDFSLIVMRGVASAAENYNVAHIQIALGVLALLIASLIAAGFLARRRQPVALAAGNLSAAASEPSTQSALARMSTRAQDALQRGSPWL